jgi:hypothetical protein
MSNAQPVATEQGSIAEQVLIVGDLAKLTPEQRAQYYLKVCASLGLNHLTKPFAYIVLNGKMVLYALRDCTDQLRSIKHVSVSITSRERVEGIYVVTARATTPDGRSDESIGAVNVEGLKGDALANALMKTETKAKRRVTLSICGLGILDETEVETIPGAMVVPTDAPQLNAAKSAALAPEPVVLDAVAPSNGQGNDQVRWTKFCKANDFDKADIEAALGTLSVVTWMRDNKQTVDDAMNAMQNWETARSKAAAGR